MGGVPLIEYAVAAALAAASVEATVLTTDDAGILDRYAGRRGVFLVRRPAPLATDTASSVETVAHALDRWAAAGGDPPRALVLVQPTTPLRTAADIDGAYELFVRTGGESVISACRADGIRHPRLMYRPRGDGRGTPLLPEDPARHTRHDWEEVYQLNGAVYIVSAAFFRRERRLKSAAPAIYEMPWERSINVDVPGDLLIARGLIESDLVKTELSR